MPRIRSRSATPHSEPEPTAPPADRSTDPRAVVRRFGALNVLAGLVASVGPLVDNDDDGWINTEPGLFLGRIAVSGPHALVHVVVGALGVRAARDRGSARGYLGLSAVLFGAFAAMGVRRFGFERGIHMMAGMAVDGWGNLGHAVLSAFSARALLRSLSE